ncbi:MAG: TetR/AcrR family transcriptional regulator [Alphaproteobacteria bacterium]|nr:TetR/AcrR family transcriptional regulator [Alphaproteobacteria bacterium]MBU6474002.1 TetR/AcrR family transcriptional regulator [Alphaproteobacteria bacterium]MDE2012668.1 TetR family transcriptional regulator [Alphaproteobacteria bacterium]MDE2071992.1 TetR family transcriptional regulator [Alphaproteobacteria bacterium]MDE2352964.1 TetR family transcriptional regulator [Alphaproteobacteria bacterium]
MARTQAADYEQRRAAILERAAELYAERGFLGASIADLAKACNTSKSLLYHYYASKEDILFDMMESHVQALLRAADEVVAQAMPVRKKLAALTRALMALYVGAAAHHKVLLYDLVHLPPPRRRKIVNEQRRLIAIVEELLCELQPALAKQPALKRPAAMLYFGMINWTPIWMDPKGPVSPERIADMAAAIALDGLTEAKMPS